MSIKKPNLHIDTSLIRVPSELMEAWGTSASATSQRQVMFETLNLPPLHITFIAQTKGCQLSNNERRVTQTGSAERPSCCRSANAPARPVVTAYLSTTGSSYGEIGQQKHLEGGHTPGHRQTPLRSTVVEVG